MNLDYSNDSSLKNSPCLGAAARRALVPMVTRLHQSVTRSWLQRLLPILSQASGLHWECGQGEDTLLIASLLKEDSKILGLDADPVFIKNAQILQAQNYNQRLAFATCKNLGERIPTPTYDFVYTRHWAFQDASWPMLLQEFHQSLNPGGLFLVEIMQLSGYRSFPYNHAIARGMDLINTLENKTDKTVELWKTQLELIGFEDIQSGYIAPAFIPRHFNQIISLSLEGFSQKIRESQAIASEEIQALLLEIRQYEQSSDLLISRPGVLQISAIKK